jgi:hypothetical protein
MIRFRLVLCSFLLLLMIGLTAHAGSIMPPEINDPDWKVVSVNPGSSCTSSRYINTSNIYLTNNMLTWWTKYEIKIGQNTETTIDKCEVMLGSPQKERYHEYALNPSGKIDKKYVTDWHPFHSYALICEDIELVSRIINLTYPLDLHWYRDVKNGYLVWNPSPVEGESVEWDGSFVDINGLQYANGVGKVSWYENGVFSQRDEGTLSLGKRHGRFVQTFADGREVVTHWNNGEKIATDQPHGGSQTNVSGVPDVTKGNIFKIDQANIFDKNMVKVGDKIAGLTVKTIKLVDGKYLDDITFSGEIELLGVCEWVDDTGVGPPAFMFSVDEAFMDKLPYEKNLGVGRHMLIVNTDYAEKLLPKKQDGVKARITIDNFSMGERQIPCSAHLVKVIEVLPQQVK